MIDRIKQVLRTMEIDPEYFNEWEKQFVKSLDKQKFPASDKQIKAFDAIFEKHQKR
jgi:hypothetical protein